jgi:uncharacterized membrane protein
MEAIKNFFNQYPFLVLIIVLVIVYLIADQYKQAKLKEHMSASEFGDNMKSYVQKPEGYGLIIAVVVSLLLMSSASKFIGDNIGHKFASFFSSACCVMTLVFFVRGSGVWK